MRAFRVWSPLVNGTSLQTALAEPICGTGRRRRSDQDITEVSNFGHPVGRLSYMSGNPVAAPTLVLMGSVLPEYGKFLDSTGRLQRRVVTSAPILTLPAVTM